MNQIKIKIAINSLTFLTYIYYLEISVNPIHKINMSLGFIAKCPEGLVLAAESRVTITANTPYGIVHNNFDNAKKLLAFSGVHKFIGVITYGLGSLSFRTAQSFMPEFESTLPGERVSVMDFADRMANFFMEQWNNEKLPDPSTYKGAPMVFLVAGFNDGDAYGIICEFNIPFEPHAKLVKDVKAFGVNWGGQKEIVDRIIQGYDARILIEIQKELKFDDKVMMTIQERLIPLQLQIPIQIMALQDCVDLANFVMRTTIKGQELTLGVRGCGGNIDVAVITRTEGISFIKKKELQIR